MGSPHRQDADTHFTKYYSTARLSVGLKEKYSHELKKLRAPAIETGAVLTARQRSSFQKWR